MRSHVHGSIQQPWLVIVNPTAGSGRARRAATGLDAALRAAGLAFERIETVRPGHARELAAASRGGVIVVGGDGTVHEVVDGLPDVGGRLGPLAVLPCGRGDDFAAAARFPRDPVQLVANLQNGSRLVDVGQAEFDGVAGVTRQRFVNHAGLGIDAEAALRARAGRRLRGRLLYVTAALASLWRLPKFTADVQFDLGDGDEPRIEQTALSMFSACNGRRFGGGLPIAPGALLDDGRFDTVGVGASSRLVTLWLLMKLLAGRHQNDRAVRFVRCRGVTIRTAAPVAAVLDGEPLAARVTSARFSFVGSKLELMGAAAPPDG